MGTPTYVSSNVQNDEPNKLQIILSESVASSIDTTGFTVSVNAGADAVSSLYTNGIVIEITLSVDIIDTDSLTVAYAGGGDIVSIVGGTALAIFTAQAVTNNVFPDFSAADPSLLTGVYSSNGVIDVIYNGGDVYTKITESMLKTPSIIRTALQKAGLWLSGDRRGKWSIIKSARDSIKNSL